MTTLKSKGQPMAIPGLEPGIIFKANFLSFKGILKVFKALIEYIESRPMKNTHEYDRR